MEGEGGRRGRPGEDSGGEKAENRGKEKAEARPSIGGSKERQDKVDRLGLANWNNFRLLLAIGVLPSCLVPGFGTLRQKCIGPCGSQLDRGGQVQGRLVCVAKAP